jgi:hypothetical protein
MIALLSKQGEKGKEAAQVIAREVGQDKGAADEQPAANRFGTVRNARTFVYRDPDRSSAVIASLAEGSSVVVHRVLWNMLSQWAEVEVGGGIGYVLTTDIDLS